LGVPLDTEPKPWACVVVSGNAAVSSTKRRILFKRICSRGIGVQIL